MFQIKKCPKVCVFRKMLLNPGSKIHRKFVIFGTNSCFLILMFLYSVSMVSIGISHLKYLEMNRIDPLSNIGQIFRQNNHRLYVYYLGWQVYNEQKEVILYSIWYSWFESYFFIQRSSEDEQITCKYNVNDKDRNEVKFMSNVLNLTNVNEILFKWVFFTILQFKHFYSMFSSVATWKAKFVAMDWNVALNWTLLRQQNHQVWLVMRLEP